MYIFTCDVYIYICIYVYVYIHTDIYICIHVYRSRASTAEILAASNFLIVLVSTTSLAPRSGIL